MTFHLSFHYLFTQIYFTPSFSLLCLSLNLTRNNIHEKKMKGIFLKNEHEEKSRNKRRNSEGPTYKSHIHFISSYIQNFHQNLHIF